MEGVLEQILQELKQIRMLLQDSHNNEHRVIDASEHKTMKIKEAAQYLGISEFYLRNLCKQKGIKHFMVGNRYLFRESYLKERLLGTESKPCATEEAKTSGVLRKVKE